MNVLVTGGLGYIGRYAVEELLKKGHSVIVVDNLSASTKEAIIEETKVYIDDIRDEEAINKIFKENKIDLVMDFAAKLIVEESVVKPDIYYDVNVNGVRVILDAMVNNNVKNIIFSSTAAVHGLLDKGTELITEQDLTIPSNPYGETKLAAEKMIKDYAKAYSLNYTIFRYFNVVGGRKIGTDVSEFTTILPRIISSIKNGTQLKVFGTDYPTRDGSCIRDFIHVYDLVEAHILVAEKIKSIESGVYNLSVGKGTTVIELINSTSKVLGIDIEYKKSKRREGDPIVSAASNEKIMNAIDWKIKYKDIEEMVKEAYSNY